MYRAISFTYLFCFVAIVAAQRPPVVCDLATRTTHIATLTAELVPLLSTNQGLRAAAVRAAFHDCVTATSEKPESGCNGSLQFELNDPSNDRLEPPITILNRLTSRRTMSCVSMADAIQLASAISVRESGGPDVVDAVVDAANPRQDATEADTVTGELPSRNWSYEELLAFYTRKGLTETDLIASSAGAHSLGRFTVEGTTTLVPFTADRGQISPSYAWNVVRFGITGSDERRHNTLPSDQALAGPADAKLRVYAGCTSEDCSTSSDSGMATLRTEFGQFLIKQSQIRGSTLPQV